MPAPMRPTGAIGRGAADADWVRSDAAFIAEERRSPQVLDADGRRLSARRHVPVPGAAPCGAVMASLGHS